MNDKQVETTLHVMAGIWPAQMQPPEFEMWKRTLKSCGSAMMAAKVVEDLANEGRQFRPNVSVFRKAYIEAVRLEQLREPLQDLPELEPPRETTHATDCEGCGHTVEDHEGASDRIAGPEYTAHWLAICRQQLAEATGPLFKGAGSRAI